MGKKKFTPLVPDAPKADEYSLYRSNLLNPLLEEFVLQNRLITLAEAKETQDQVKFSGLFKVEQFVKLLKQSLDDIPQLKLTVQPGDIIAGVQMHQNTTGKGKNEILAQISPPSQIDISGSYLHGTVVNSSYNVDINITLPDGYLHEKDFQNYGYFDKRAIYVAAVAMHLRHCEDLKFSNLYISHEVNDQMKPIIVIKPSQGVDLDGDIEDSDDDDDDEDEKNKKNDKKISLKRAAGLLGKFTFILHFVPPINSISTRKLAPNRNNVKVLEQHRWVDFTKKNSLEQDIDTPLSETILMSNIAPTPDYNHSIIQDLLSTSQACTYSTLLSESKLMKSAVIVAKMWLKLRGLYLDPVESGDFGQHYHDNCRKISFEMVQKYQQFCSNLNNEDLTPSAEYLTLFQTSPIHYSYHHHYNKHSTGFTGTQVTHLIVNLFLTRKVTVHNNLQYCIDAFFRFFLLNYPNNHDAPIAYTYLPNQNTMLNPEHENNLIMSPLVLPPDYDDNLTISTLQQSQEDYKALYATIQPSVLFHSFDVVMLDCNNIFNVLYNIPITTWYQVQSHALYGLKLIYGNNMGSLLSHEITPEHLCGNLSTTLRHSHLGPLSDQDIFSSLFTTRLTHSKHGGGVINGDYETKKNFELYLTQLHRLYLANIDTLINTGELSGELKTFLPHQDGGNDGNDGDFGDFEGRHDRLIQFLQSYPQYNEDLSLLNHDSVYDVSLPVNYAPFYPILNALLYTQRVGKVAKISQKDAKIAPKVGKNGKPLTKSTTTPTKQPKLTQLYLHEEYLIKIGMTTPTSSPMPLFISSKPSKTTQFSTSTTLLELSTVYGTPQTPEQYQKDGDLALYMPQSHSPTTPLHTQIAKRMTNILTHSYTNRVTSLLIEPVLNTTHTSFIWKVCVRFDPAEASRSLDKGPQAEQAVRCKEWRSWWGSTKSELRRFPDGAIMEVVVWNNSKSSVQLPNEQIPFIITQYILPIHLFATPIVGQQPDITAGFNNSVVVTMGTHPFGAFLQYKNDTHLLDLPNGLNSAQIISDGFSQNLYQNLQVKNIEKLVSINCPIPNTLLTSYHHLQKLFREMDQLPLGVDNVECTSAAMRGTMPFFPKQHLFDIQRFMKNKGDESVEKDNFDHYVNHFFSQLLYPQKNDKNKNHFSEDIFDKDPKLIENHNVFEPINIVLTLGHSNKWPQNDLVALSRIKTAFYLKLAQIIRQDYSAGDYFEKNKKMSFSEHQQQILSQKNAKNGNKKNNSDNHATPGGIQAARQAAAQDDANADAANNMGPIYSQVTENYIDIYLQGYIYRCRIMHPGELSYFRSQTSNALTCDQIPPLVLNSGLFRTLERELIFNPKHATLIKNLTDTFPILATTTQFIYRWLQAHYLTRNWTIELCELLVASIFVQSSPFTIPTSLPASLSRILYRLSTFQFGSNPIIIPNFDFSMSSNAEAKLHQEKFRKLRQSQSLSGGPLSKISVLCLNHQNLGSYYHGEYSTDINIDQLPRIYAAFNRAKSHNCLPTIFISTTHDVESKIYTMRPATHVLYQDHLDMMLTQLHSKDQVDQNTTDRILASFSKNKHSGDDGDDDGDDNDDDDDDDDKYVRLAQEEELELDSLKHSYRNYYSTLIDRGELPNHVSNSYNLISSINLHDLIQLQSLTKSAFHTISVLLNINTAINTHNSITTRQIFTQERQIGYNKELWPLKAPNQWSFKHFLGLFKPNLMKFDAFIVLTPDIFTVDQMKRSIWLFKTKSNGVNTGIGTEYGNFIDYIHEFNGETDENIKNQNNKNKNKKKEYKLPPDLVKKLKEHEETQRLLNLEAKSEDEMLQKSIHDTNNFTLYAGLDYLNRYVSELRASFGQYASFYTDPNGARVIGIKFHSFLLQNNNEQISLEKIHKKLLTQIISAKTKQQTRLILGINDPIPHLEHVLQTDLHLVGYGLDNKIKNDQNVTKPGKNQPKSTPMGTFSVNLPDLLSQMAQLGSGIVQNVYIGYDDFSKNIYF
jgi:hypothetical protein